MKRYGEDAMLEAAQRADQLLDEDDMAGLVDPGRDPIYPRHYRATALLPASVCYRGVAVASKKLWRKQR